MLDEKGEIMNLEQLTNIIQELNKSIDSYWNFYTLVIIAVIGWLIARQRKLIWTQSIIIVFGLILFFGANASRLGATFCNLQIVEDEKQAVVNSQLKNNEISFQTDDFQKYLLNSNTASRYWYYLHIPIDILVIIFVIYNSEWKKVMRGNM